MRRQACESCGGGKPGRQVKGTWGKAVQLPGAAVLNARGDAEVESVSCARTGYCAAGGFYTDRAGRLQAFIASRVMGRWAKTIQVPGVAALAAGGAPAVSSVSCPSAGNYVTNGRGWQTFVVSNDRGGERRSADR